LPIAAQRSIEGGRLNALTYNLLVTKFRGYYIESSLDAPPSIASREWGFLFFDDSGMRRHKSFFRVASLSIMCGPWCRAMSITLLLTTSGPARPP